VGKCGELWIKSSSLCRLVLKKQENQEQIIKG
jgi:hypothetical protein